MTIYTILKRKIIKKNVINLDRINKKHPLPYPPRHHGLPRPLWHGHQAKSERLLRPVASCRLQRPCQRHRCSDNCWYDKRFMVSSQQNFQSFYSQ